MPVPCGAFVPAFVIGEGIYSMAFSPYVNLKGFFFLFWWYVYHINGHVDH